MIKNAKITHTFLGVEDHGIFTFQLRLKYGDDSVQSAGGWTLDTYNGETRVGTAEGMDKIMRLLETLEADSWESLKGKDVRVDAGYDKVVAIGHLMKEKWVAI
jgi:hypothetical protein